MEPHVIKHLTACRQTLRRALLALACLLCWSQAWAATQDTIYLYSSPITKAFFAANGTNYDALKGRWEEYLRSHQQRSSRQVSRAELLAGLPPGVLLLGSAVLLDDQERQAINRFADSGGSVLATWGTGARDGKGRWSGYGFVEQLFDVKINGLIASGKNERFLNTFGDSPLSWPLPAGERIFVGDGAEQPLRVSAKNLAGRYFDWGRLPTAKDSNGAISFIEKAGSRRVYLSFCESSWEFDERSELPRLFNSIFAWLRHQPQVFKAAWPHGDLSAQLLEMDTEDKFANGLNFARELDANGIRGTFYALTSVALKNKDVLQKLAEKHEIGYHAEVHVGFKGKSESAQEERLKNMVAEMKDMVGSRALPRVTGFRAPTESYDETTEKLLRRVGIRHHVVDPSSTDARLPFFSKSEIGLGTEDAIVVLPRSQLDDLNYLSLKLNTEKASELIALDFDYLNESGSLGVLSIHSQNYAPDGLMAKLTPPYLKRLQEHRKDVWTATGGDIEAWWRARERVVHEVKIGEPATALNFTVRAPGNVGGLTFFVTHPMADAGPKAITPRSPQAPRPEVSRIDAYRSAIIFRETLPTGQYSYGIEF